MWDVMLRFNRDWYSKNAPGIPGGTRGTGMSGFNRNPLRDKAYHAYGISPFTARSGHNFFPQRSLYPTCIQAQRTVKASNRMKIFNHIARHNTINTGRIRSNQVRHSSPISQRVRWSMGLMVYSDDDFYYSDRLYTV